MIFEAVQILVSLTTVFTSVRLLFLHADSTRIGCGGFGVEYRERPVGVVVKLLIGVAMLGGLLEHVGNIGGGLVNTDL